MRDPAEKERFDLTWLVAWLLRRDVAGRLLRGLVLALIGGCAALVLAPGSSARRLPGRDALGSPAPVTIKAGRDYEIVDEEATARRRAEASAGQRAVYDFDEGAADEAAARIHAAFSLMREEEALLRAAGGRREPAPAELARVYAAQRDAFVSRLQLLVRDTDLDALAAVRFGEQAEQELAALAARGLEGMVVADLGLLRAERGRGIVVRSLRAKAGGSAERTLLELGAVRDLADARLEVERAAEARLHGGAPALRAALVRMAQGTVAPTLVHNQAETARRRAGSRTRWLATSTHTCTSRSSSASSSPRSVSTRYSCTRRTICTTSSRSRFSGASRSTCSATSSSGCGAPTRSTAGGSAWPSCCSRSSRSPSNWPRSPRLRSSSRSLPR